MKSRTFLLAILLLVARDAAAAEPLGRLFFTPAQRTMLDAGKELDRPKKSGPQVRGPRSVTVNGIVTRSDGESTVWVNGEQANIPRRNEAAISAKPSGPAAARVRVMESDARLSVGQTLDRRTGRVTEPYQTPTVIPSDTPAPVSGPRPVGEAEAKAEGDAADQR
jgi:hypothetical protein